MGVFVNFLQRNYFCEFGFGAGRCMAWWLRVEATPWLGLKYPWTKVPPSIPWIKGEMIKK